MRNFRDVFGVSRAALRLDVFPRQCLGFLSRSRQRLGGTSVAAHTAHRSRPAPTHVRFVVLVRLRLLCFLAHAENVSLGNRRCHAQGALFLFGEAL